MILGVLEDGELPADHMEAAGDAEHIRNLGGVLYNVAAAASGSESDTSSSRYSSSDNGSRNNDSQARKKRKRSE